MKETVNKKQIHIGIDVSKKTLDVCCLVENQTLFAKPQSRKVAKHLATLRLGEQYVFNHFGSF